MRKKIAVVTGTRAEYGILKPLLQKLDASSMELQLFVTGLHLLEEFGLTIGEITDGGFAISGTVEMYGMREGPTYHGQALSKAVGGFTEILHDARPDVLVLLGDRLEVLAATLAAATHGIAIAHVHGGDKTDGGHIDESIRHSISRFAHIHFTACKSSSERLIRMGEEEWRVHQVGALGLDSIVNMKLTAKNELEHRLGIDLSENTAVCVFHPVSVELDAMADQMAEVLSALAGMQTVVVYPNNDLGSQQIIEEIEKRRDQRYITIVPSIPHEDYLSLLRYSCVLVGNSSCGIIEAPSLGVPVVNVGSRNLGREHAENILSVEADRDQIQKALEIAIHDVEFKNAVQRRRTPYGSGKASEAIVDTLAELETDRQLMTKRVTY